MRRFHCQLEDHIWTVRTRAKVQSFFWLPGLLQEALRYLQPVTGCPPEGWYPFLHTVLVFDTPCISTGTDYLNCISIGEYTWNGGKVRIWNRASPAGILWPGELLMSNWCSWPQFLLLVTSLSVIIYPMEYLLILPGAVILTITDAWFLVTMHQIILSWTGSNVKVLSYFKLKRTPKLYRNPSCALSNKLYVIGFYSWDFFSREVLPSIWWYV